MSKAKMPERVWLDPKSEEAEFIGDDHFTESYGYYASTGDGIPGSVEYVRNDLEMLREGTSHPGYVIGIHWMPAAYARICQGEDEEEVMSEYGWRRGERE